MLAALCFILFLLKLNGCVGIDESQSQEIRPNQKNDNLRILSAFPSGRITNIDEVNSIVAVFNQPMVPLQALPEGDGSGPIRISPNIKGKYRWMGSQTLKFILAEKLRKATRYTIEIPSATQSLKGAQLSKNHSWSFETPRPKLLRSTLSNNAKRVILNPIVYLQFNQKIDFNSLKERVYFFNVSRNTKLSTQIRKITINDIATVKKTGGFYSLSKNAARSR